MDAAARGAWGRRTSAAAARTETRRAAERAAWYPLDALERAVLTVLLALACSDPKEEDSGPVEYIEQSPDTGPDCGGTAPVVTAVSVGNGGLGTYEGVDQWSVEIEVDATDEDSDLRPFHVDLWWDQTVDGVVERGEDLLAFEDYIVAGKEACEVGQVSYRMKLAVAGTRFDYDTLYEFAAVIYDAQEMVSEVGVGSGYTPKSDGTDGGPAVAP
jgi:hypothetical protein